MEKFLWSFDREECNRIANEIFIRDSGISKDGRKFERMREDASRMRKTAEERIEIRGEYIYSDNVLFDGRTVAVEGVPFTCNAFEQVNPETVKGVYIYALSAGDFSFPEDPILDQLYADIWGSAFTDAARILMKKEMAKKSTLSDGFGPGFYGMDVNEMSKLASLIDFNDLKIELRDSRILLPLKSCAGLYFAVTENYRSINSACESCLGSDRSCVLCHVRSELE